MKQFLSLFESAGYSAYIVGGTVRDVIMGRESNDVDITTSATPNEIIEVAELNHLKWIPTGIDYGTITIIYNNQEVQVTTFRKDINCDGRHAEVQFSTSLSEDLFRRDFTCNSICLDIYYNFIDEYGGINDIHNKIMRAIGDPRKRYAEDKDRIPRLIRQATDFGFTIESNTWKAIDEFRGKLTIPSTHYFKVGYRCYHIHSNPLAIERIRDELIKILKSKNRVRGIKLLYESSILDEILPDVSVLWYFSSGNPRYHPEGNLYSHTLIALSKLKEESSLKLCLATLFHDIGKPQSYDKYHYNGHDEIGAKMTTDILTRLKFPSDIIENVSWLVANHMRIHKFNEMRKAKRVRLMQHPLFDDLFELLKADLMVYDEVVNDIITFRNEYKPSPIPSKLINGHDILALGIPAGKMIGEILTEVEDQILEGTITNRDEALKLAEQIVLRNILYKIIDNGVIIG